MRLQAYVRIQLGSSNSSIGTTRVDTLKFQICQDCKKDGKELCSYIRTSILHQGTNFSSLPLKIKIQFTTVAALFVTRFASIKWENAQSAVLQRLYSNQLESLTFDIHLIPECFSGEVQHDATRMLSLSAFEFVAHFAV